MIEEDCAILHDHLSHFLVMEDSPMSIRGRQPVTPIDSHIKVYLLILRKKSTHTVL